jgi:hypothetical protein
MEVRVSIAISNIWILARYDVVRVRTMSYVHPTTSYVRRTMSGSISHVRHRTYDITYDIARTISYVFPNRRCYIRHRTLDVRCRRFRKFYVIYDVVCEQNLRCRTYENVHRIRCRRCLSYTMSYVFAQTYDVVCLYDIVYFYYIAQNLRYRRCTYDVVCMTYDIVRHIMRSVPAAETPRPPPAGACQHGRSFSRDFRLFLRLSVTRAA